MGGELILVVDDNPVNLKLVRVLLVKKGYEVYTAADADEALTLLERVHPRLTLMDIQLSGMDGLMLPRRLKADPATCDIIIVALTAYAMKADEQKAREAGYDGYIPKPIETRAFIDTLTRLLAVNMEAAG